MIKAAIFDLDGTLVDSNELHVQAWQETFRHFGKEIPVEELRAQIADLLDHYYQSPLAGWLLGDEKIGGQLDFFSAIAARQTNLFCDPRF